MSTGYPFFQPTLPAGTVLGNPNAGVGPPEAMTFAQLLQKIQGGGSPRPASPTLYQSFFDTVLGQPIWCTQVSPAIWVNSAGATV